MDLKQNALLRRRISPHRHCKYSANERKNIKLLEYFTANAAYFRVANIVFFTTNAQRGIYFFIYNVVCDTALWIFSYLRVIIVHQTQTILWQKKMLQ
jgi:hypothetical protein